MLSNEELNELYWDVFDKCSTIEEEMEAYKAIIGDNADDLRELYCDNLLYAISSGFTKYEPTVTIIQSPQFTFEFILHLIVEGLRTAAVIEFLGLGKSYEIFEILVTEMKIFHGRDAFMSFRIVYHVLVNHPTQNESSV